ncbi:MAG: hypothetical protein JJ850_15165 [Kordiimonadaceae bacterium]|nr:hypothetical protein [Kordiimonadaceae bacterium]MBO6569942.1 hypothetical protein [Kordiimonadaceae bacterium]MBO6965961.1 hypothetical protein [Kordiimonadaceae bacterium]
MTELNSENQPSKHEPSWRNRRDLPVAVGICLGLAAGAAMGNPGAGMVIGIAIGVAIASSRRAGGDQA